MRARPTDKMSKMHRSCGS